MNPPEVACRDCKKTQPYVGQANCVHCERPLVSIPPWAAQMVSDTVVLNGKLYKM